MSHTTPFSPVSGSLQSRPDLGRPAPRSRLGPSTSPHLSLSRSATCINSCTNLVLELWVSAAHTHAVGAVTDRLDCRELTGLQHQGPEDGPSCNAGASAGLGGDSCSPRRYAIGCGSSASAAGVASPRLLVGCRMSMANGHPAFTDRYHAAIWSQTTSGRRLLEIQGHLLPTLL